jgi:hypothetical protein
MKVAGVAGAITCSKQDASVQSYYRCDFVKRKKNSSLSQFSRLI